MSSRAAPVSFDQLLWMSACLALALLPQAAALPVWVTLVVAVAAAARLGVARRGRGTVARGLRLAVAALAVGLLFLRFRTFNGLGAGTALLSLMAGLKLLETDTRRDLHVLTFIIYFLALATLLGGESFWLLAYLIGVCWLTVAMQLRWTDTATGATGAPLRAAAGMLAQALPLALLMWLFFPRIAAPLWPMPQDAHAAASGLGDTMSPGDITDLALSDDVAFRVRFDAAPPPPVERYWRGPVLHDFDGRTWRRGAQGLGRPGAASPPPLPAGPAYRYRLSLEPSRRRWIYALERPAEWDLPRTYLAGDDVLVRTTVLDRPVDLVATSYTRTRAAPDPGPEARRRDTRLPPARNPRTVELARELRAGHPDDTGYVQAVLAMFAAQPFFYTLEPPMLGADSVDEFLFDTRRGFCGHYASAFATLMRAAGIPARVVTGYQGGTYNRFADYWIVRQSDAHAWDEVWLDGRGWVRVDPTAAIAPQRVIRGPHAIGDASSALNVRWQVDAPWLGDLRLRMDVLRQWWRERILRFDQGSQERLLSWLHVPDPSLHSLALALGLSLTVALLALAWQLRRGLAPPPADRLGRSYARLCRKMAALGLPRFAHEDAERFAARVGARRPDLAAQLAALCRTYTRLRYGRGAPPGSVERFAVAVRRFHPRRR